MANKAVSADRHRKSWGVSRYCSQNQYCLESTLPTFDRGQIGAQLRLGWVDIWRSRRANHSARFTLGDVDHPLAKGRSRRDD